MLSLLAQRPAALCTGSRSVLSVTARTRNNYTTDSSQQVSTFANQNKLPRLPIPTLKATATRYLKTLRPLLDNSEYARAERAVSSFISSSGLGPVLQRRLQEVDRQAPASWLENIWVQKAYLEWREPNYINANWAALLADNPNFPAVGDAPPGQPTGPQLARAARLILHLLEANDAINQGTLTADSQRGTPMCMNQFKWQFGTSRIARPGCDGLVNQYPSTATHILVMYRDQTIEVPVYNNAGQRASLVQITSQLLQATRRVDDLLARQAQPQPSVANITAGNRDNWANARQILEKDTANVESLAKVDSALFGVCLDVNVDAKDIYDPERSVALFTHSNSGCNRWFDKAIQLIVLGNGRVGVNCEHTPADALTTGSLLMEAMEKETGIYKDTASCAELAEPMPIQWNVTPEVVKLIDNAQKEAGALAGNLRMLLGNMTQYGAQWIKTLGVSPDAYFQVALQTAYFRHHGKPAPTYETSSLRRFLHGRTETIRSCSEESLAFSKVFDDKDVSLKKKLQFFQQAIAAHLEYSKAASLGQGVDRHLLGLRAQIQSPEEAEKALLFQDPSYIQSMSFAMSTSNVTPGEKFRGAFAPVIPDGYGINYAMDKSDLKFSISEWLSSPVTDATAFRETIYKTLSDLYDAGEYAKRQ
ncbi:hypothetical protein GGH19_004662 [Coemansia sp. RSA 1807]|nr:hypothetical protein GGH19_004662 [Coemansia sp. RSA 1807]